jgi:IS30 family transposase
MLMRVFSKDTATVVAALGEHIRKLPASLRRSLTWDRGLEMDQHKHCTVNAEVKVYFCDPQGPWQRGSNEIINGLLRQCFPKRTDLSTDSHEELDEVALRLNQRPKKTFGSFKLRQINCRQVLNGPIETARLRRISPSIFGIFFSSPSMEVPTYRIASMAH